MILLDSLISLSKAIALLFGDKVEVIIHDVKKNTIIHVENNFSNRKVGDASLLEEITLNKGFEVSNIIGPYNKISNRGHQIKSISTLIRDEKGKGVMMVCINFDIEDINIARNLLDDLLMVGSPIGIDSVLKSDWRENANLLLNEQLKILDTSLVAVSRKQKIQIIQKMDKEFIFDNRGSADYVATMLGISRANFYSLLKLARDS